MVYVGTFQPYFYLSHHGVKGQKWGIRRYQNPDGTLTEAGRRKLRNVERKSKLYKAKEEIYGKRVSSALKRARKFDKRRMRYSKLANDYAHYADMISNSESQHYSENGEKMVKKLLRRG